MVQALLGSTRGVRDTGGVPVELPVLALARCRRRMGHRRSSELNISALRPLTIKLHTAC